VKRIQVSVLALLFFALIPGSALALGHQSGAGGEFLSPEDNHSPFLINGAISDAWYDPETNGQGFFIIVWEGINFIFLSWFTFDTELPPPEIIAALGSAEQRWLTAQGPYEGDTATLDISISSGGSFNSDTPEVTTVTDGTITIKWTTCNSGVLSYNIPSLGLMGDIPIERIILDNVPDCQAAQDQQAQIMNRGEADD
jgi:hypothetical protein